ncbi:YafY family transcriptional regulator [Paenibacillus sp. N4]|uniref:helix-turn-helix transcriptional regulator n=1 Tax=Paenibacillus vietnamensis TaxID=2590547 RepID=UPI001CD0921D|nr:YafY family protein [Paenibacillus vietnamensis]MCA0756616.1 YafY family transcriptional regulator [Paenibacillus vietnamensis]
MRASRLMAIVLLLQNRGKLSAKELAQRLEVSERTVVRDMEALSGAGIPVYAERGAQGGWRLSEGYRTQLTGMKPEELAAVIVAAHGELLSDLGIAGHFEAGVQKLIAASPAEASLSAAAARQKIHIDGAGWHQAAEQQPLLPAVQEAVWESRKLLLRYAREEGIAERIVHPLGLVAKRSVWYLVAETEDGLRTFRISRLLAADRLEETFERPAQFELAAFWEQSVGDFKRRLPSYPAKVLLSAEAAGRLERERYVKTISAEETGDGRLRAELEFQTLASACEIVLSFGPRMEVLEPSELRERVAAELKAAFGLYRED